MIRRLGTVLLRSVVRRRVIFYGAISCREVGMRRESGWWVRGVSGRLSTARNRSTRAGIESCKKDTERLVYRPLQRISARRGLTGSWRCYVKWNLAGVGAFSSGDLSRNIHSPEQSRL